MAKYRTHSGTLHTNAKTAGIILRSVQRHVLASNIQEVILVMDIRNSDAFILCPVKHRFLILTVFKPLK